MSEYKFLKLIEENSCIQVIPPGIDKENLYKMYIDPVFKKFFDILTDRIVVNDFKKTHYYRYQITVHAQEYEND